MARLIFIIGLALQYTSVLAKAQLEQVAQLEKRNPYYGGFALAQGPRNCPANTETCATGFCCPIGTYCGPAINGPYCCASSEDCQVQVATLPTCADPSWNMFMDAYTFCCEPGYVGVQGESCQSTILTFSAGDYAATETQANTAQPPATRPPRIGSDSTTTTTTGPGAAGTPGSSSGTSTTSSGSVKSTSGASNGRIVGNSEQVVLGGAIVVAAMLL